MIGQRAYRMGIERDGVLLNILSFCYRPIKYRTTVTTYWKGEICKN